MNRHTRGNITVWYALDDQDIINVGHTISDNDTYDTWTHEEASESWGDEPLPYDMQKLFDDGHKEVVRVLDYGADIETFHAPDDPDLISELDWAKEQIEYDLRSCQFLTPVEAFEYVNRNDIRADLVKDKLQELVQMGELDAHQIIQTREVQSVKFAKNLDALCDALNDLDEHFGGTGYLDTTSLPTFGDRPIKNTSEVWSWDDANWLSFNTSDRWDIQPRCETCGEAHCECEAA